VHGDDELGDAGPDPLGDRRHLPVARRGQVEVAQQHHELLAAETADDIALPHLGAQRRGDRGQDRVTREVPVGVVDGLEVVQVEDQDAGRGSLALRAAQRPLGLVVPGRGVEQAGLAVHRGPLLELARHVGPVQHDQRHQHEQDEPRVERHGHGGSANRETVAVETPACFAT
jgi:hypothetical protein